MNVKLKSLFIILVMFSIPCQQAFAYSVIPSGEAVGVVIETNGVLVAGTSKITDENGRTVNPAKDAGIIKGDRIIEADGKLLNTVEELSKHISEKGTELRLTIIRNNKKKNVEIQPAKTTMGYKLGILVRDSTAGIGTLTFVDPSTMKYAGLGHGISDPDTSCILPINGGNILKCNISAPTPGKCGIPGELNGEFLNAFIGTVELNTEYGIFGKANELPTGTPMEIADKNEVKQGDAYILANVDGNGIKKYRITIKNISKNDTAGKNMVIEITDSDLIAKTGGIVQGMSGSPIIQSNMLVGAVTHVFIDNPQKGYAIFAEKMLKYID